MSPSCLSALSRLVQVFLFATILCFCCQTFLSCAAKLSSYASGCVRVCVCVCACVRYVHRALSTTTCAGHASTWLWCGSMRLWCWWVSCFHRATATCSTAPPLTWAAGRNWSTAPTATPLSICERLFAFVPIKVLLCVCDWGLDVFLDGPKALFGPKEF